MHTEQRVAIPAITAVVLVAFFFLPVVPYSASVPNHIGYRQGYGTCWALLQGNQGQPPNATQQARFSSCLAGYRYYYGANITGWGSLSYRLIAVGVPPFSRPIVVTINNATEALYFKNGGIIWVEEPLLPGTVIDPQGVVEIENVSASFDSLGVMAVNVTVRNTWQGELDHLGVSVGGWPGYGNLTLGNPVTFDGGSFVLCAQSLLPGDSCKASPGYVPRGSPLPLHETKYNLEVRGYYGSTYFVYHATVEVTPRYVPFSLELPRGWVIDFMGYVDAERSGPPLVEDSTLDQFAALRFRTMISNYSISHYGYSSDHDQFFNGITTAGTELYLYPVGYSPGPFASYLQSNASQHWETLMNAGFTHYGYYFGTGPAVVAVGGCVASEIPGPNLNVTLYLESLGCSVAVLKQGWLVIELGP